MNGRREFLQTGGIALLGLLSGTGRAAADEAPHALEVFTLRPENLATPLGWFDRPVTPNDVFFVRSHFGAPARVRDGRLRIEGLVTTPLDLSVADLQAMPQVSVTAVAQCAGNGRALMEPPVPGVQWVHGAMGQAVWSGVRLHDLLQRAGVRAGAAHIALRGADRPPKPSVPAFARSIPLQRAADPATLVALRMNGEPLPHAHGAPMRLIVPGWTANHWVKWLQAITVQAEEAGGFYMQTAYRFPRTPGAPGAAVDPKEMLPLASFPVKSVIARPQAGQRQPRGVQEVVGVAFSGDAAIGRVEVSVDGGATWHDAALEGESGVGRWQVFRLRFDAAPGRARAMVRATDARGARQPEHPIWNPSGYLWNAWHAVEWEVV
ncbi:MAG TPA: sulfite oxidase [Candidatus Polarisedimenticolia bacterium]|nr:sulfite oxidase [Candidatus Polarisedimenticolia bacterium]